jgi:sulfonate transport system substrate-binding protein
VKNQKLSPADAHYTVQAFGQPDVPRDWTEAIALQQASINLMARETRHKPFDANTLFDRRFETVPADAIAAQHAGAAPQALAAR